jgi:RNA polymerase sigma factor (sigma-70 family)
VPEQDTADVLQEVFWTVSKRIKAFTKDGRPAAFRRWLYTTARYKVLEYWGLHPDVPVDPACFDQEPALEADLSDAAEAPARPVLIDRLLKMIQLRFEDRTWKAFWEVAVEARSAKDVAKDLGMTAAAVHTAKCRVLSCLRKEAEALGLYRAEGVGAAADIVVVAQREVTS